MAISLVLTAFLFGADNVYQPRLDSADLGIPFHRYTTTDSLGRTITFYLSVPAGGDAGKKLPVALLI